MLLGKTAKEWSANKLVQLACAFVDIDSKNMNT